MTACGTGRATELVVAIDGPAGAGKSTVAWRLAQELGYLHLNSGALYRAVTLLALRRGVSVGDGETLARIGREASMEFLSDGHLLLNGEDATEAIRSVAVDEAVSQVSVHRSVRQAVTSHQRRIAAAQSVVAEGRDVTTVVFPDAPVKFYLNACIEERARRRHEELRAEGENVTVEDVEATIRARDARDSTRLESPLKVAPDAHVVDTTALTIDEVVSTLASIVRSHAPASAQTTS